MKLTVLSEAKAGKGFRSEHGLSFYIEVDRQKTLFDTGASDIFLENAMKVGLNLDLTDRIVLSHGHYDHGDGLQYIDNKRLVCHPGCFVKRYRKQGSGNLGIALSKNEIERKFDLHMSEDPIQLSDHLFFLGEVPRNNDFEARSTRYSLDNDKEDFIIDDSGLVCITGNGLVVISGCAHSGICNMIEHAIRVTGIDRVYAVIGGFHLSAINSQTRKTIEYLKKKDIQRILPSHCTMEPALSLFYEEFGENEVIAGSEIIFQ